MIDEQHRVFSKRRTAAGLRARRVRPIFDFPAWHWWQPSKLARPTGCFQLLSETEKVKFLDKRLKPLEDGLTPKQIATPMVEVLLAAETTADAQRKILQSLEALRVEPYKMTLKAILTTDFRSVLPKIKVPSLIIVGDEDKVLPPLESEALARLIPHSQLTVITGVGHLSNIEAPQAFNSRLAGFLKQYAS